MSRADRVAGKLQDVDALLVTDPTNLRYVTGFSGSNGYAVVGRDVRRFVTDFRYVEQAKVEVPDFDREQGPQDLFAAIKDFSGRLGFDDAHMSVKTHRRLAELLEGVELVPASGVVEEVRAVKEPGEILRIGAAAALVDEIYALAAGDRARRAAPSATSRSRWSTRCGCAGRPARRSRRSSPRPSTARCRTRSRATWRSSATRW